MMEKERCSYCDGTLRNHFSMNCIFVTPTIYKCRRWHCNLLKKWKIYQLNFGQPNYGKPVKRMMLKLAAKINF